jgi:hypothetical protein
LNIVDNALILGAGSIKQALFYVNWKLAQKVGCGAGDREKGNYIFLPKNRIASIRSREYIQQASLKLKTDLTIHPPKTKRRLFL